MGRCARVRESNESEAFWSGYGVLHLINSVLRHNRTLFTAVLREFTRGRRHHRAVTESYRASEVKPEKCHLFLEQQPRKTLRVSLTGIDSLFYLETGKFVMTALKIPEVSSYFVSLCKSTDAFEKDCQEFKGSNAMGTLSLVILLLFTLFIFFT